MCDSLEQRRQRFIEMARECHGDRYDYSQVIFTDDKYLKVKIICPTHGLFEQYYMTHLRPRDSGSGYMGCRKCGTDARSRKQLCVDCGCWDKYGGSNKVCKDCSAKRKESRRRKIAMKYLCRQCGNPTGNRERIYCSSECRVAKNRIVVRCGYCDSEIVKAAKQVRRSKKLFCNPECQRLSLVGNGDPHYASKKAKEAWKKKNSMERRLSSEQYKWWRLCNKSHFTPMLTGWAKRCSTAVSSLSCRARPKRRGKPGLKPGAWGEAFKKNLTRIEQVIKRQNVCAWTRCCRNKISGLSRRRRIHNERQNRQENRNKQAVNEADRETGVQMCFEWNDIDA